MERKNAKRPRLRWLEAGGWLSIVVVLWGVDLLAKFAERDQMGFGKDDFRLVSEQVTSGLAVLVMIPFVLRWLSQFPLRRDAWVPAAIGHTAGTVLFAFGHQALMIAMRIPWYAMNGIDYIWREPFVDNLIVEYQKDIKVYFGIVVIATAWRFYLDRQPGRDGGGRLVVQTGQGMTVLRHDRIEYLEAARNYVGVHADGREHLVRDTFANLMEDLAGGPFLRCHRSFAVNVDRVREIRAVDGRQRIVLDSGAEIPLSRGFRDAVTNAIRPTAASG